VCVCVCVCVCMFVCVCVCVCVRICVWCASLPLKWISIDSRADWRVPWSFCVSPPPRAADCAFEILSADWWNFAGLHTESWTSRNAPCAWLARLRFYLESQHPAYLPCSLRSRQCRSAKHPWVGAWLARSRFRDGERHNSNLVMVVSSLIAGWAWGEVSASHGPDFRSWNASGKSEKTKRFILTQFVKEFQNSFYSRFLILNDRSLYPSWIWGRGEPGKLVP